MSHFEYKVITSGRGGFASPVLLEKFLNDLGQEEWEIVEFRSQPDNPLAFSGLARRATQRDWTLENAAAAAARAEVEKLRAEFEAKFKAGTVGEGAAQEKTGEPGEGEDAPQRDDSFRRPRDTERDLDPTAAEEENNGDFNLPEEEELPTFFEAIRPHMRRNQRGPGLSVSVEYLVKKFDMLEGDLIGALKECGLVIPAGENEPPAYVEYDGDLYWVNVNRQRQLFINTREKPRPVFRTVQAQRVGTEVADEAPPSEPQPESPAKTQEPPSLLPTGSELLDKLRPLMRRSRGGWSGSASYLSRAIKHSETELNSAFAALGLRLAEPGSGEKPPQVELGDFIYWLNRDGRGNLWINAAERREKAPPATAPSETSASMPVAPELPLEPTAEAAPVDPPVSGAPLAAVRLLLKETKTGAVAGKVDRLAEELGKSPDEFLAVLADSGLKIPEKAREKPVFVEHAGEIFWLNKNARGELWLNAKASKFAEQKDLAETDGGRKPKRTRTKKKEAASE